jgi:type I restriction enzyme S subunit
VNHRWDQVPLGEIAQIDRSTVQPADIPPGTAYVGLEHIEPGGGALNPQAANGDLASTKFSFGPDHVLYGKLRPYLAKIACPDFGGVCSTDILPILPGPTVDKRYLFHFLRLPRMVDFASSRAVGANLPRLSPAVLAAFHIPLPPLPEQRRIARVLDQAELLRQKRGKTNAGLNVLSQSLFLDTFGDPGVNPNGWPIETLSGVVRDGTIVTYGIVQAGPEHPSGVPYIRTGDIVDGEILRDGLRHTDPQIAERFARSRVDAGDIVMSIRATVGTTAVVPDELHGANLTQGTARIAPGPATEQSYLLGLLRADATQHWINRQIKGATFREITLTRLRQLPVPLPPLGLQREYAKRAAALDGLRRANRASAEHIATLCSSLQAECFQRGFS